MQRRWVIGVPLVVVTLVALITFVMRGWHELTAERPRDSAVFAVPRQPTSLLTFVALDRGYFAAHGLDVRVETYPSGKLALQDGLFAGRADFAWANDVPVALAAFERSDFRIIAVDLWADNVNKIVARRDRGIAGPQDLRGKRIATQKGSAVHFFLHLFLLRHNLTEDDVALSFMQAVDLPEALAAGAIDAFSMREPFISEARAKLGDNAIVLGDPGVYEQVDVMLVRQAFLDQNPRIASKALQAMLDAEAFVAAHPQESAAITAKFLDVPVASVEKLLPTFRVQVGLSQSFFVLAESEARWAVGAGLVKPARMPNYLRLIDAAPLEQVKPDAVTLIR